MSVKATQSVGDACEIQFVDEEKVENVRRAMKSVEAIGLLAETFRILGDPTRIKIAFALSKEELCVCDIANLLGVSQSAVSHSLRTLRQMKLVRFRREGKIAYYTLDDEHIANLFDEGFRHVEELL
ncbi:MAG: winged helix-turn-helix transcriptional regulator [Acidobacteria bacterium]|jgi:DNA-binding transcriptional ArsR family regulator|nr:winged helix-turn-helix transcriptional regulator [Acidobacteriota bacterium]MCW5949420.1 winged helix-turn-helix transcriptional regulator [Pyrinomonadaceae bacterium]